MLRVVFAGAIALYMVAPSYAHEIYTGVHGKDGQLCCGGTDCGVTSYRENGENFEFLTREKKWVKIPGDRITFAPIPGDGGLEEHQGHLCYRPLNTSDDDSTQGYQHYVVGEGYNKIWLYCAFIPPGSI